MPTNECIPFIDGPVTQLTGLATANITGKRLVAPSANRESGPGLASDGTTGVNIKVAHASANGPAIGVAAYDIASGARGPIICDGVVPITADGSISAGAQVSVGSSGKVKAAVALAQAGTSPYAVTDGSVVIGIALTAAADGDDAEILLTL